MRNPNFSARTKWRSLSMAFSFLLLCVDSLVVDSDQNHSFEWQILTKRNFSSQIRTHQHVLLIVTDPWCGESRSLMKEVANIAANKPEKLDHLKLMVLYRSSEKMLTDVLGATNRITIFCYHHSVSFKYQGRLRAQNILASVSHLISLQPEELPLKPLNTLEDLKAFLESTDKAVLLLEFCGWTLRLLGDASKNGSKSALHVRDLPENEDVFGFNFNGETNRTFPSGGERDLKGLENECGVEKGLTGVPWLAEFTSSNNSIPLPEIEKTHAGVGASCSYEKFQQFELFLSNFTADAREFFLPPERQRFGLVSKRSLLSSLGVGDPETWLVMLHFMGCPNCSQILKERDDLKSFLQMPLPLVPELECEGHGLAPALPANEPSVILFVDRSSESSNTSQKSKELLNAFRELVLHNQIVYQKTGQTTVHTREYSAQASQGQLSRSISDLSGRPRVEFYPATQMAKLKDEMAVMIINEGGNVGLDDIPGGAAGNSIHDIFAKLLQQKKGTKLSLLAKEAGFQLLSDDFETKIPDLLPSTQTSPPGQVPSEHPMEAVVESSVNLEEDSLLKSASLTAVKYKEQPELTDVEPSPQYNEEKITYIEKNKRFISAEPDKIIMNGELGVPEDTGVDEKASSWGDKLGENHVYQQSFKGSYFFSDAGYKLLGALTAGSKIPSMVILDPLTQQHYIFPEETTFSYSSMVDFLNGFLNGSLLLYQRSESVPVSPREATHPPFINLDFQEADSVPRVTVRTFSEQVLGFNQSDAQNVGHAWKKDVLVLFSNSWCGFCQRTELVVREVYRAFKGYMSILKNRCCNRGSVLINGM